MRFQPGRKIAILVGAGILSGLFPPLHGHRQTAPWLDDSILEGGLYLEVRHPRVIRNQTPFPIAVAVNNLAGEGEVLIREVRYHLPGGPPVIHARREILPSKGTLYRQYQSVQGQLGVLGGRSGSLVEQLHRESRLLLLNLAANTFRDRQGISPGLLPAAGSRLDVRVEIEVVEAAGERTLQRTIRIPVHPPLPSGSQAAWFSGDQHLHTAFSLDALLLDGTTELVTDYAAVARTVGLDWIILTDHSNIDFLAWYKPPLFRVGEAMAAFIRNNQDYLVLQGQEMGAGSLGRFGEPAHLLVYPGALDSTGFLPNPCSGLIFNHVNCEPEQVVLDRIEASGGIGFIAHPFDSSPLAFSQWDRDGGALGWAGLEIFNSSGGTLDAQDEESIGWWHELLREIAPPQGGELAPRPDFPTRFPVGLGNSDAHQPGAIGATFTYARLGAAAGPGGPSRMQVMEAFLQGRCVASNGPLLFGEIHGAGVGEVAVLPDSGNLLEVTLQTTSEFGPVGQYEITVLVDGSPRLVVPPSGSPAFETTLRLEDLLGAPDRFVTLRAVRADCGACPSGEPVYQAIANPIWLEF